MQSKAEIISWASLSTPNGYPGWRVRFSFQAACGRNHTISQENVWADGKNNYYSEEREIACADVENGCPDADLTTTVELVHPHRLY